MHKVLENLSEIQRKAAATHGKDLVVTAGAGAGKTRVLVSRYLYFKLALDYDYSEILAITFTEKAAAEMKDRVREKLLELGEDPEGLDTAYISTFHSFCLRILKEHPAVVGLDPEFKVLDELRSKVLLYKSVRDCVGEGLKRAEPEPKVAALITVLADGVPSRLIKVAADAYQAWQSSGLTLEEIAELSPSLNWLDLRPDQTRVRQLVEEILARRPGLPKRTQNKVVELERIWEQTSPVVLSSEQAQAQEVAISCDQLLAWKTSAKDLREECSLLHEAVKGLQGKAAAICGKPILDSLLGILRDVDCRYRKAKAEENGLDFTDLILQARKLFQIPWIQQSLRCRFKAILVDEYQDTNGLQKELIDLIRSENSLFVVGDPKQSIYRFRGAEVEVFAETAEEILAQTGESITLNENYRSRGELLKFCNRFFADLFVPNSACSIKYSEITSKRETSELPRVELLTGFSGEKTQVNRKREAEAVAYRIYEMVTSQERLVFDQDPQTREEIRRPVTYGDITLLFRSKGDIDLYASALQELGIPILNLAGTDFFYRQEIKDILAFFRRLVNPQDELALAVALRSPLFGLSDPELFRLKKDFGSLNQGIRADTTNLPAGALEARELIQQLQPLVERIGPSYFLDKLLTETGYPRVVLEGKGGEQAYANLRKFQQMVQDLERAGLTDLVSFLEYVDNLLRTAGKENEAQLAVEGTNAVRLMTIHASKGLEFRVVFVVDGCRAIDKAGFPPAFRFDRIDGFGFRLCLGGSSYPTSQYTAIQDRERQADYQEAKRIFYVAVTRAQDYLVLSGIGEKDRAEKLEGVDSAHNWVEWLQVVASDYDCLWKRDIIEYLADAQERLGEVAASGEAVQQKQDFSPARKVQISWEKETLDVGVSDLLQLNHCPRQFYYQRVLGLPQRPRFQIHSAGADSTRQGSDPILRGNLAHLACAHLGPGDSVSELVRSLTSELSIPKDQSEQLVREVIPLIRAFQDSELFSRLHSAQWSAVEEPFVLPLAGLNIGGTIDKLAVFSNQTGLLVDYKSNMVDASEVEETTLYYQLQLQLYAAAVRNKYPESVSELEVGIYYLVPGVYVPVAELSMDRLTERLKELRKYLIPGEIRAYPRIAGECGYCAYKRYCKR